MALQDLFTRHAVTGQNPEFLIGRQPLINDLANRFAEDRTSGIVYGTRGVGKTSIAWQVATILAGTNKRFRKGDVLTSRKTPDFLIVVHKCTRFVDTVGDLLLELVFAKGSDFSFGNVLSRYYEADETLQTLTRKITGGIPKIFEVSGEEKSESRSALDQARKHFGSEAEKVALFNELLFNISRSIGDRRLLFIIDEFDRPRDFRDGIRLAGDEKKDIEGVGELIKDVDLAQFLLVGIAESVSEILKDHKSAGRKMSGCIVQAPLMSNDEIGEIFGRAERSSKGLLAIDQDFANEVVRYSSGLPWIAQHIGYEAVRNETGPIKLDHARFDPALKIAIENYAEDADVSESIDFLEQATRTDFEVLDVIWDQLRGAEEGEIRKAVPQRWKQNIDTSLKRLLNKGLVIRKGNRLIFKDPIVRVFAKKYIDDGRA